MTFEGFIAIIVILAVLELFGQMIFGGIAKRRRIRKIKNLANQEAELTPKEFFSLRKEGKNFPGVYVLHNKTKNLCYVGQGTQVFNRVNSHLTGKGNGDVYADYKYGDEFSIRIIPFQGSGYDSINALERIRSLHTMRLRKDTIRREETRGRSGMIRPGQWRRLLWVIRCWS